MARPVGITISGVLVLIAAFLTVLIGIAGIVVEPKTSDLGFFFLGGIFGVAGAGLLRMRPRAWWLASVGALAAFLYTLFSLWVHEWVGGVYSAVGYFAAVFLVLMLIYLLTTYRAFRQPRPTT